MKPGLHCRNRWKKKYLLGSMNRYVILPEDGPREEGSAIALDLYGSRSLWRGRAHGSPERAGRVTYGPEGGVWGVRELG